MVGPAVSQLNFPIHYVEWMEPIDKLFIDAPVERNLETLQERFSRARLDRRNGAAVLELNALSRRVHLDRGRGDYKAKNAGNTAHKSQLPLTTAAGRSDFEGFGFLATSAHEAGTSRPIIGRMVFAIFIGFKLCFVLMSLLLLRT